MEYVVVSNGLTDSDHPIQCIAVTTVIGYPDWLVIAMHEFLTATRNVLGNVRFTHIVGIFL